MFKDLSKRNFEFTEPLEGLRSKCNIYRVNAGFRITDILILQNPTGLNLKKVISSRIPDLILHKALAANCETRMYHTLKTGIPTQCTAFLRIKFTTDIIIRDLAFERLGKDELILYVYPPGALTSKSKSPTANIMRVDKDCRIIKVMSSTIKDKEALEGKFIPAMIPDRPESECSEFLLRDTIETGQENTWFAMLHAPNCPPLHTYFKASQVQKPSIVLATRHIS